MNRFCRIWVRIWLLCLFLPGCYLYTSGFANQVLEKGSEDGNLEFASSELFSSNETLNLTILSDFSSIMNDRGEDRSYHKGLLYYLNDHGDTISRKVKLKTRGNFRRNPENCKYPPIMVKFGKLKTADSLFAKQSKLKLVTQCQLENYVLLEYTAYRIYNIMTDLSYRVRLAHITYADLKTREAYFTRYAFFIENIAEMEARLNMEIYKPHVVQYFLDRENVITMATIQYLLGNDDWYVTSGHNVSILKDNESDSLFSVAYDFDWSKFVDAQYTKPEGIPNHLLKDRRIYKGLCMNTEDFLLQQKKFNAKKDEMLSFIKSVEHIPKSRKQSAIKYVERFYKTLNYPSSLERIFQKEQCVSKPVFK